MKKYIIVNSIHGSWIGLYIDGKCVWQGQNLFSNISLLELVYMLTDTIPVNYYPQSEYENNVLFSMSPDGKLPLELPEMVKITVK